MAEQNKEHQMSNQQMRWKGMAEWGKFVKEGVLEEINLEPGPEGSNWQMYILSFHIKQNRPIKVINAQLCPTLCDRMDCSPPDSSVHGILQARILEWEAIPFSRGSPNRVSCIADFLPSEPPGKPLKNMSQKGRFYQKNLYFLLVE